MSDELLFQTGAPELVVQNGELKALDGRYCINQFRIPKKNDYSQTTDNYLKWLSNKFHDLSSNF